MKNAVPVSVTTLELDEPQKPWSEVSTVYRHWWIEAWAVAMLLAALMVGLDFWRDWFSSVDRVICSICVLVGLIVAFIRSAWQGEQSTGRFVIAAFLFSLAVVTIGMSFSFGRPKLSGIACGLILAAWCSLRILGENVQHSMMLGSVFAIPSAVDAMDARGTFKWLESVAINVTSGLADAAEQAHVREGTRLIFGLGVADRFSCVGKWDSVVSFLGIGVFCVLAFRRNLLSGLVAISMAAIVWISVRASAWVVLAWMGIRNGIWYEWSFGFEVGIFLLGAFLVISIDQLFSAMLEPIPMEFINTDFPLFAFLWNWLSGLPTLTVTQTQGESYFGEIDDDLGRADLEC
ncbi:MAG TPA: hypothetical protein VM260_27765 [Pirellula sp.]|nr:hypothetical protein [Pirellula sp.]